MPQIFQENAVPQTPPGQKDQKDQPLTLAQLRASNHPALKRIAERAAQNMKSSGYTSHNSHYSAHTS